MSIKSVGGLPVLPRHRPTYHCGAAVIELDLPDGIVDARRCDCSICRRKRAVVASVPLSGIRIVRGEEHLRLCQFDTRVARHYFCGRCGIHTHHQRRSFPGQYGYKDLSTKYQCDGCRLWLDEVREAYVFTSLCRACSRRGAGARSR